jgi:molecular chaperone HscC
MSRPEPVVIGIDLGTTYSLVAIFDGERPRVLQNGLGEVLVPSAVSLIGGELVVGSAARARWSTHPTDTAVAFKRDMGLGTKYRLGEHQLTPQALSSLVLKSLREDAEAVLGRPVGEAVVTVPAYFDDAQRRATHEAAELAGLHVERLLNEPTAAAIAFGLHELDREVRAVVLDLGGGTFDVTVLEIVEGVVEVQATAGDTRLGGEDFTHELAIWAARRLAMRSGREIAVGDSAWPRLVEACERAKRQLTREERVSIELGGLVDGRRSTILEVDRQTAEELWDGLLDRLRRPIERALRDARLAVEEVEEVLLVGGATRTPCFRRLSRDLFGREPRTDLPADEAVALGAAIQAALKAGDEALEDLVVTDVAPFSLGIDTSTAMGGQYLSDVFSPILERGTVIPASRVKRFQTVHPTQRKIEVNVYQGEHVQCTKNRLLGTLMVDDIPPAGARGFEEIDVRFTYDLNGILEIDVLVLATREKRSLVLEQAPGRLAADEMEAARNVLAALKFHPRDALPNTVALARAEALYEELLGSVRQSLGEEILAFRAILENQDPEQSEQARQRLNGIVELYRG